MSEEYRIKYAQIFQNESGNWFLQVCRVYGLSYVNTSWQCSKTLGTTCYTPSTDIEEYLIPCTSEENAMFMLAEHYAKELAYKKSQGAVK